MSYATYYIVTWIRSIQVTNLAPTSKCAELSRMPSAGNRWVNCPVSTRAERATRLPRRAESSLPGPESSESSLTSRGAAERSVQPRAAPIVTGEDGRAGSKDASCRRSSGPSAVRERRLFGRRPGRRLWPSPPPAGPHIRARVGARESSSQPGESRCRSANGARHERADSGAGPATVLERGSRRNSTGRTAAGPPSRSDSGERQRPLAMCALGRKLPAQSRNTMSMSFEGVLLSTAAVAVNACCQKTNEIY